MAAASEGNPVSQKPEQKPEHSNSNNKSNGNGNGNGNGRSLAHCSLRRAHLFAQQTQQP
ncbi:MULTISPECIES: hypothetical protein [Xanthomonas]|uniref:hypothetical protein n=1 Tax=Xanthomonas TaxID=338 RepID=UPI001ADA6D52|nr:MULTISPECIES: hypothetical protein [unclassified Xanthomonas]MBO9873054.1 hypothetical protein [Xanthomonas sp. D-93]WNH44737.1 hypothetical protein PG878_19880 [Xanthomonas sp. A6251]